MWDYLLTPACSLIELEPAHRKYRILELYNRSVQVRNTTAIVSGYAGRDPQEETSDGSVL